jgi:hypothetical protein
MIMKSKNILKKYVRILALLFVYHLSISQADKPLDIRFNASGPFPINYDEYIDNFPNANITIRNKTNKAYEFEMYSFIVGPYNISGESRAPHCTQGINSLALRTFPRGSFNDLCINYRIADFEFDGIPEDLKSQFFINHILPEGEYEICIQAKEVNNTDNVLGSVCFKFSIVHPSRPIITQPTSNYFLDATVENTLNISWTHSINNPRLRASTSYNVKIIDLGLDMEYADEPNNLPPTYSPYELMEDPGVTPVLFIENVKSPYIVTLTDLNLSHGHNYAIAIYALNTDQPLGFDLVRSDIVTFEHFSEIELECGKNIVFDAVSPVLGSYIPFTKVPLVMHYSPYCDKYTSFSYTTLLEDITTQQQILNYSRKLRWNYNSEGRKWKSGGPRRYFNYVLNDGIKPGWDSDAFYSSHLALGDLANLPLLTRGHTYSWITTGTSMEYFRKPALSAFMTPLSFTVGMQAPLPNSPIGGERVDTGKVRFNLKFSDISGATLPPFKIVQIIDDKIISYEDRRVNEYGVLQVSKDKSFSAPIYAEGIHLQFDEDDFYDSPVENVRKLNSSKLNSQLYADLNFEGRFTDSATYYWRLGWYKNPDVLPNESDLIHLASTEFYTISAIDSFRIGDTARAVSAPVVQAPTDTVCGSTCTITSPANSTLISGLTVGDEILIGKFLAKLTEVTGSGSGYNGKARIKIPFLNNVTIKVNFTNLKVNTNKMVFEGEMIAEAGGTELESIANIVLDQPMQLPLGWDATVKGRHTVLALTSMKFFPTRADLTASINFGDLLPEHMALPEQAELSGTFCFHPGGFSESMIFHLSQDMVFDENQSGYGFQLKGGQMNDTSTMSYIKWDCHGFHSFQIAGDVLLSESLLNKDSGNESNDEVQPGRVKAGFKFKYLDSESANANDNGFILSANIDAFQFKDFEGWGFDSDTIYIDWSDSENPPGFSVPQGYTYPGMNNPQLINGWEGLYIPNLKTFTPKDFGKGVNTRTTFSGSKLLFGEGKYYVGLQATNIFNDSWARMRAKMDTIQGVISSEEKMIRFKGGLLLPFTDTTSWLDFGGHFSGLDSIHLYVAIAGDSVHMEDLPLEFKFDNTSLLNIIRGSDHTFRANAWFNGVMDLETNAGHIHPHLSSLNYKGIKFENLGYKSGIGFESGDFSFASPQKTMNGFPIQLDSIDFVNEGGYQGFYFKPKIVLVGDENGFSAAAGMNLLFKFNFAGNNDYISDTKLELKDVELDVAVSGFELKGRLAFINRDNDKGMEGILAAKLPSGIAAHLKAKFGTKTTNDNAAFNTAANYSYWYVDGMVTFGKSGIPMFAGMSLYGIGGGMWYHMTQNPITTKSYEGLVGTATDTANLNYSGIGYQPNFNSNYGMKLQGLFGSENEGKTYNMLLSVWAQFNGSGGPNVGLDGDMRFMGESVTKLANGEADTTKKNVWGKVEFEYNSQERFIQGNLAAYANITVDGNKVFYGKMPRDKIVDAAFYAGPSDEGDNIWYLKIGTPESKAGAVFDLKIKKTDISAYLMAGHGLPNEVPAPDPGFMAMLNRSDDAYSGGDVNDVLDKEIEYSASGIAAGILLKDTFDFDIQPFYLDVNVIIGADINIRQCDDCQCVESGKAPGVDGWYGTGQLYAGIQGAFGIHVDLWFIEGKFEFLRGSIALLMKGGLPNPSWFYAKGALKYEVLGLVEGIQTMELNFGEKCTMASGNPFGDMPIIQDIYPAHGEKEVSVYVDMKALISPAVDKVIEVYDVEKQTERVFKVNFDSRKFTKAGEANAISTNLNLNDGTEIFILPKNVLDDRTYYSIEVTVSGSEKNKNGQWDKVPGFTETKKHTFKTGIMPDYIVDDVFSHSYPVIGQNFFLKNERPDSKGFVALNQSSSRLFYKDTVINGHSIPFKYEARFSAVGQTILKKDIQIVDNRKLFFDVSDLKNNTTYTCKIYRVRLASQNTVLADNLDLAIAFPNTTTAAGGQVNLSNIRQEGYKTVADMSVKMNNESSFKVLPQKFMRFNSSTNDPKSEHLLFEYKFKTSAFNTLTEKLGGKTWTSQTLNLGGIDQINLTTSVAEKFDEIDLQGYKGIAGGTEYQYPPLIQFGTNLLNGESYTTQYFNFLDKDPLPDRLNTYTVYDLPRDLKEKIYPINAGLKAYWGGGILVNAPKLIYKFDTTQFSNYSYLKLIQPPQGIDRISQTSDPGYTNTPGGASNQPYTSVGSTGPGTSSPVTSSPNGTVYNSNNSGTSSGTSNSASSNAAAANQGSYSNGSNAGTSGGNIPFKLRVNYGAQIYRHYRHNQDLIARYATPDVIDWMKTTRDGIYKNLAERVEYFKFSQPHGRVDCNYNNPIPFGIIYTYPKADEATIAKSASITAYYRITCPTLPDLD